jgi:hypothetical protein
MYVDAHLDLTHLLGTVAVLVDNMIIANEALDGR